MQQLTKDDFDNWWNSKIGIEFKKVIEENLFKLAHGNMTGSYARDQIGNAIEVGRYQAMMEILKIDHNYLGIGG